MADGILNCLDLIKRTTDLSRALAAQNINRTINDIQLTNFTRLLNDVDQELEIHGELLSKLTHIKVPEAYFAQLTHEQCNSLVTDLKLTLGNIKAIRQRKDMAAFPTTLNKLLVEFKSQFEKLSAKLEKLVASINLLHQIQHKDDTDSTRNVDNFVVTNMVQPNPLHIFLNFQSEWTPECQLKNVIFQGPDNNASIVASGMGGIGKTCALRGVGLLEEARSRFPGGILYMYLGADAGKVELIRNLAGFVKQSGGAKTSIEIVRQDNIAKAVTLTAEWFCDHECLFLLDDVRCRKGIDSTVTEVLAGLARNSRSRVALTTRDRAVRGHIKIQFKKRSDADSKKLLLRSSGCTNVFDSLREQSAFQHLLNISDGLPNALDKVGKRARHLIEERSVDEKEVWALVRGDFPQPGDLVLGDGSRAAKNESVFNV